MLQIRPRDSADRRFYAPERDMVYAIPRILKHALLSFDAYEASDENAPTREDLIAAAGSLGQLITAILDGKHPNKELSKASIYDWLDRNKPASSLICEAFSLSLFGQLWAWSADARPRRPGDGDIPAYDLAEIDKFFSKR
jgi:hypothetical protein